MGYYNGSGVVTGGGWHISPLDTVISGGTLVREVRTKTTVTVKNGVSLSTAQAASPSSSVACGDLTCGNYFWPTPQASGVNVNYSYSQIDGSNLYALVEDREEFQKRLCARSGAGVISQGGWASLP